MLGDKPIFLGTAILPEAIPLLGSNRLLERLGAIIDIPAMQVRFTALDVSVDLVKVGGHLAVNLVKFTTCTPHTMPCWTLFERASF